VIISLLNQKGGVGKTTLSINLAAAFARTPIKTLLVDADPQGSALAWSAVRDAAPSGNSDVAAQDGQPIALDNAADELSSTTPSSFSVVGMPKATLHKDLQSLASNYAITIIDGAPRVNDLARSAIMASDLVLIPAQPSPLDVWATDDIISLIIDARDFRPSLRAAFVVNRKIANTVIGRDVAAEFDDSPFDVLPISIGQRVIFAETLAAGLTVFDQDPEGAAANEISSLARLLISQATRSAA